jgi:hypothetical protein
MWMASSWGVPPRILITQGVDSNHPHTMQPPPMMLHQQPVTTLAPQPMMMPLQLEPVPPGTAMTPQECAAFGLPPGSQWGPLSNIHSPQPPPQMMPQQRTVPTPWTMAPQPMMMQPQQMGAVEWEGSRLVPMTPVQPVQPRMTMVPAPASRPAAPKDPNDPASNAPPGYRFAGFAPAPKEGDPATPGWKFDKGRWIYQGS